MASMHLIGFPNKTQLKRGLAALFETPLGEFLGLPDYQMVVTNEHIKALEEAKVRFTYLSKTAPNDSNSAPVRSQSTRGPRRSKHPTATGS